MIAMGLELVLLLLKERRRASVPAKELMTSAPVRPVFAALPRFEVELPCPGTVALSS